MVKKFLLLFLYLLSLTLNAHAAEFVTPNHRVDTRLIIRSNSSVSSTEIGELRHGDRLPYIQSVPWWHEVQLDNGITGFVSKGYSTVVDIPASVANDELRLHFLAVGAGSCTLIECPGTNSTPMLVDCGSHWTTTSKTRNTPAEAQQYIQNILSNYNNRVNLVTSHADFDHYTYIPIVLSNTQVLNYWMGGDEADYSSGDYPNFLSNLRSSGTNIHTNIGSYHTPLDTPEPTLSCGNANTYVLTHNAGNTKNSGSLVLLIENGDFTVVITGDATGDTEDAIINNYNGIIKATVISASHHGSSTHQSNSQPWIENIQPNAVIYSSGQNFQHPRCASVNRYHEHLSVAPTHQVQCDSTASSITVDSSLAEYMTEASGTVVIRSNGRSPFFVSCEEDTGCNGAINH